MSWEIIEQNLPTPQRVLSSETMYTVGNGFMGIRGSFEEGYPGQEPGTLLRGITGPIPIGREELINCPNFFGINLFLNGERLDLSQGTVISYRRSLNMKEGVVYRALRWRSPEGIQVRLESERFCCLSDVHVAGQRYNVSIEEAPGPVQVKLRFVVNASQGTPTLHWKTRDQGDINGILWLLGEVKGTGDQLAITAQCKNDRAFQQSLIGSDVAPYAKVEGTLNVGESVSTEKVVAVYTSLEVSSPLEEALKKAQQVPYSDLKAAHLKAWQEYWDKADIVIEGDPEAQQSIRYCLYQLRCCAPPDALYSIAAKGLSGLGYRGHIFHDTDVYMLPFYCYALPDIARNLCTYRYNQLPQARVKAQQGGWDGAQYPWESGAGRDLVGNPSGECTPPLIADPDGRIFIVHNGAREIHISAAVAYAVNEYWKVTGDDEFMLKCGLEIIVSTALFYASRATWKPSAARYEITGVIGPDEWHEGVSGQGEGINNNAYTNYLARYNIEKALEVLGWLEDHYPSNAAALKKRLKLTKEKISKMENVARKLFCPYDSTTGLIEQFEGFFGLKKVDVSSYGERKKALRDILGPEETQRAQVLKQADTLALLILLWRQFDERVKRANWDYYYPITDGIYGSSLSRAFQTVLACELGLLDEAYAAFMAGGQTDLVTDSGAGWHMANAGSTWQAIVFGFAGLRLQEDGQQIVTHPQLPPHWTRLAFQICVRGEWKKIDIRKEENDQQQA